MATMAVGSMEPSPRGSITHGPIRIRTEPWRSLSAMSQMEGSFRCCTHLHLGPFPVDPNIRRPCYRSVHTDGSPPASLSRGQPFQWLSLDTDPKAPFAARPSSVCCDGRGTTVNTWPSLLCALLLARNRNLNTRNTHHQPQPLENDLGRLIPISEICLDSGDPIRRYSAGAQIREHPRLHVRGQSGTPE
jgi:hypothetical protein